MSSWSTFLDAFRKLVAEHKPSYPLRSFDVTTDNGVKVQGIVIRPFNLIEKLSDPADVFTLMANDWIVKVQGGARKEKSAANVKTYVDQYIFGVRQVRVHVAPIILPASVKWTEKQLEEIRAANPGAEIILK